jgi:putative membrane protein
MVLAAVVVTAIAYVAAAAVAVRRGRAHSPAQTVAFLAGLAILAVALRESWGPYDDETPWVHATQHALVMAVAPPLLALGAPVRLSLQVLPTRWARGLVGVLHARPLRALCGPASAVHVPLDYYGVMALYLFTAWAAASADNAAVHVGTHVVFLVCGLLFWVPVVGADVAGWRPDRRTALWLVAVGLPIYAVFSIAAGSLPLLVANEAATVFGLTLVAVSRRSAPAAVRRRRVERPSSVLVAPGPARP